MAVASSDPNVDSVGACVGQRGLRVQSIIDELNGEKIDIIEWDPDPVVYISHALSPAKVIRVEINEEEQSATVVVPDHQLSLAIGREGQNARLAARLTGWKIDIKNEAQYREMLESELFSRFDQALAEEEAEANWAEEEFDSEMVGADDWVEDEEFDLEAEVAADRDSTEMTETEEADLTDDADSAQPASAEPAEL
jgi:N utilization substance protein A